MKQGNTILSFLVTATVVTGSLLADHHKGFSEKEIKEWRNIAKALSGPLPDKMPGSEKDSPERIALGKKLYSDTLFSKNQTISCNSCHQLDKGGVDGKPTSSGAFNEFGDRNSPTVLNAGFQLAQFWDGRAKDLKAQAKGPVLNPIEMGMPDETTVLKRINQHDAYPKLFKAAFSGSSNPVTYDNMAEAIASFERTLITKDRFDDFLKGDNKALSNLELKGLKTFIETGCVTCHNGPLLGGNSYQKVGLLKPYPNKDDLGLYNVTKNEDDKYKFKVPTLRNIALTSPYFHDGGVFTLEEAVRKMAWMQLAKQISDDDAEAIVAFLHSLSDKSHQ